MKPSFPLFAAALAAALGLAGCGSHGEVHVGDTTAMVHGAMGSPDAQLDGPNGGAHQTTWIYTNFHRKPPEATGWTEVLVPGVSDQNNRVVQAPVTKDIYRASTKEDLLVVFTDDLVSSIQYQDQ